jgi:hypothetical protein
MSIKDINEIYQDYIESDKFKASLYTPANAFAGYLDLIDPRLSLKKDGFDTIEFRLSAKIFNMQSEYTLSDNPFIDTTLDGYYLLFEFGDIPNDNYEQKKFIIKDRNSELKEEQATFSYVGISAEYELKKLPIINWPGIEVKEYKDVSREVTSQAYDESTNPLPVPVLLDDASGDYTPIALRKTPKNGKMIVTRIHTVYQIEETLSRTNKDINDLDSMPENEYYYDSQNNEIITWVPAHIKLPTNTEGSVDYNDPVDSYRYFIYYETEDSINESTEIVDGEFEKAYFYNTDGLTINQILDDLFQNLTREDSNLRFFHRWTYDSVNSFQYSEVRSGINFSKTNVYEMLKSLEENYNLFIEFDTINYKVIVREKRFGANNGLRFEYGKYLTGVSQEINTDEVINYIQGQDADGVGFADSSWSGDNYIENYDYLLDGAT